MSNFAFVLIICTVCFCSSVVDATVCKPLSAFKIDCDECVCSVSGREYTCYSRECKSEISRNQYNPNDIPIDLNRRQYNPNDIPIDLNRRQYNPNDIPIDLKRSNDIPYIDDEIPNSRERLDNDFDDLDFDDNNRDKVQEVDSNEDASLFDTGYPAPEYRYRRSLKPLALKNIVKDKKH